MRAFSLGLCRVAGWASRLACSGGSRRLRKHRPGGPGGCRG